MVVVNDMYAGLRAKWLGGEWAPPAPRGPEPYAVLFETTSDGGTATIVAAEDGTASIYTSTGGGMIGLGERPEVARAAIAFVALARRAAPALAPAASCPVPPEEHVAFWACSATGTRGATAREADAMRQPVLRELYAAAQDLITQMRLHAPAPR